jgi:rod shape-determining protein MreC
MIRNSYIYFILIIIALNFSLIVNFITNISKLLLDNTGLYETEINLLTSENNYLKDELSNITELSTYANYNYTITRLSFRSVDNKNIFYINGGNNNNFKTNYALVNSNGLVGIITEVYDDYSICNTINNLNNLSIKINNNYGTISEYDGEYLISKDFSNQDNTNLNDIVYTSELGIVKESIKIGTITKIENTSITKTIYIKPFVDFNNISYLYVVGD